MELEECVSGRSEVEHKSLGGLRLLCYRRISNLVYSLQ
jgi:hypothetical protein